MIKRHTTATAVALLALLVLVAGCGGGSSSSDSSSTAQSGSGSTDHGNAAFLKPGSPTNELVEFGTEASAPERLAAEKVIAENFEARESADFAAQCETFAPLVVNNITGRKGAAAEKACPATLKKLAEPLKSSASIRADTLKGGHISAFRVKGDKANALYHGTDKKDYAVPVIKTGDRWLVGALLAIELNPARR